MKNYDFEQYMPRVFDWAVRLTRNRQDAMDVVQDVYLKWRRQCATMPPERPDAWLRTVTTRRVFEIARSPRLRLLSSADTADAEAHKGRDDMAGADRQLLRDDMMIALERLTDMQRDVLLAKIIDEHTFARIAEDLEVSASTVKTHYLRAIRTVRSALTPRWRNEP